MNLFYLDLEWRSELDVTRYGTYAVAEHPSTEVLCCAFALDDGPVHVWRDAPPASLRERIEPFLAAGYRFVAHNIDADSF